MILSTGNLKPIHGQRPPRAICAEATTADGLLLALFHVLLLLLFLVGTISLR